MLAKLRRRAAPAVSTSFVARAPISNLMRPYLVIGAQKDDAEPKPVEDKDKPTEAPATANPEVNNSKDGTEDTVMKDSVSTA